MLYIACGDYTEENVDLAVTNGKYGALCGSATTRIKCSKIGRSVTISKTQQR